MEIKKQDITEKVDQLEKIVGGNDSTENQPEPEKGTFADLPRVDDNPYTPDILNRT